MDYQKIKFCISFISPMSYLSETPHEMYCWVFSADQVSWPKWHSCLVYSLLNHPILQMYVLMRQDCSIGWLGISWCLLLYLCFDLYFEMWWYITYGPPPFLTLFTGGLCTKWLKMWPLDYCNILDCIKNIFFLITWPYIGAKWESVYYTEFQFKTVIWQVTHFRLSILKYSRAYIL